MPPILCTVINWVGQANKQKQVKTGLDAKISKNNVHKNKDKELQQDDKKPSDETNVKKSNDIWNFIDEKLSQKQKAEFLRRI